MPSRSIELPRQAGPSPPPSDTTPSWSVLKEHATQLTAVAVGLFLLMKTYSVAKYSLTTASALLTAAPVAVVLGTLTSYEYVLWPLLSVAGFAMAVRLWSRERWSVAFLVSAAVSVTAALLSPAEFLVVGLLALVTVCLAHEGLARASAVEPGRPAEWLPSRYTTVRTSFVVVTLAALVYSLPDAWLPAEAVVYRADGDRRVVVGHVVSADAGWVTVLRGGDRGLTRLPAESVRSRQVCHLAGAQPRSRRPLALVLRGQEYESPNLGCRKLLDAMPQRATVVPGSFPASHPYRRP